MEQVGEQAQIVRDIEARVFQASVIKCLAQIEGVTFIEGTLFDHLLGREGLERIKGVYIEQDAKAQAVDIKIELNIAYGISIPAKSKEIESKLIGDVAKLTGSHVRSLHVVVKNVYFEDGFEDILDQQGRSGEAEVSLEGQLEEAALAR